MKRFALILLAGLGMMLGSSQAQAWTWWSKHKLHKCDTLEDRRLQAFWDDYYRALHCYYGKLDHVDWVAYYKNHGYEMPSNCCGDNNHLRVHYYPVVVSPSMQWLVPNG